MKIEIVLCTSKDGLLQLSPFTSNHSFCGRIYGQNKHILVENYIFNHKISPQQLV